MLGRVTKRAAFGWKALGFARIFLRHRLILVWRVAANSDLLARILVSWRNTGSAFNPVKRPPFYFLKRVANIWTPLPVTWLPRLLRGSRDEETRLKALNYSEQACLGDDARGCVVRGDLARELSLKEEAGTYYRRACDLNDALGCYRLALLSDQNRELLLRACDANVLDACIAAGVGALNENPPRFRVAGRLFAKACDEARAIGCYQLAKLWETHPHFIPGPGALRGAKKRACEGGVLQACGASINC